MLTREEFDVAVDFTGEFDIHKYWLSGPMSEDLLWETTTKLSDPHQMFLAPPVNSCLNCGSVLSTHNQPCNVICYTWNGPLPAKKLTLKCYSCGINYRYEQYGNNDIGYKYYKEERALVCASQVSFVDRNCYAMMVSAG